MLHSDDDQYKQKLDAETPAQIYPGINKGFKMQHLAISNSSQISNSIMSNSLPQSTQSKNIPMKPPSQISNHRSSIDRKERPFNNISNIFPSKDNTSFG